MIFYLILLSTYIQYLLSMPAEYHDVYLDYHVSVNGMFTQKYSVLSPCPIWLFYEPSVRGSTITIKTH